MTLICSPFTNSVADPNFVKPKVRDVRDGIGCGDGTNGTRSKADKSAPSVSTALQLVRQLLFIYFAVVIGSGTAWSDEKKPDSAIAAEPGAAEPLQYQVKVLSSGTIEIGRPVLIGIYGSFANELKDVLGSDTGTVRNNLKLYLNGVPMNGPVPEILPTEAAVGLKTNDPKPTYVLQFVLDRNSNDDANREAWDKLLPQLRFGLQGLQAGVGLNGKVPHLSLGKDLQFQVRDPSSITAVIVGGVVLFLAGMFAVIFCGMVRESGNDTPYSLGKTQMAFWGLLVAISFVAVWLIGHRMERIPSQVLILMGISGVTGLSSVVINNKSALAGAPALPPSSATPSSPAHPRKGWFTDIISDGDGVSFQRLQVVLWTLILGFVFASTVANTCSMPEFENTLLVLMGISNGLYLGFKIPETRK